MTPVQNARSIPSDASLVERWWLTVHNLTLTQMPISTALSYPVPQINGKQVELAAFYYGIQRGSAPGQATLLPPIAWLVATYPEGRLLSFERGSAQELFPNIKLIEGALAANPGMSPAETMQARKALFNIYPTAIEAFATQAKVPQSFANLFDQLVVSSLLPFYQQLNPAFYQWLKGGHHE